MGTSNADEGRTPDTANGAAKPQMVIAEAKPAMVIAETETNMVIAEDQEGGGGDGADDAEEPDADAS